MKNITDRIDARIQLKVLTEVLHIFFKFEKNTLHTIEKALNVLIGPERPLTFQPNVGKPKGVVQYSIGQGMGTNVSFPLAAFLHHMVVKFAAFNTLGVINYKEYCVLGDDLMIRDKRVADLYLTLMYRLGVECSIGKSFGITPSASGILVEFAKRNLYSFGNNVYELTPLTPSVLSLGTIPTLLELFKKDIGAHLKPGYYLKL
jgi:hypothetical protein